MKNNIEICVWKLITEANKKIPTGSIESNPRCEKCDGYKIKCGDYQQKPEWYGKD